MIAADVDINRYFLNGQPIICNEPWKERVGLSDPFPDNFQSNGDINWVELRVYVSEFERFMGELVDSVTMTELDRSVEMGSTKDGKPVSLGAWKGVDFIALHGWTHVRMHGGEIACLKGLQGGEGYRPFSSGYHIRESR